MTRNPFPLNRPIPIDVIQASENDVDWDQYYGRFGTEDHVFSDFYGGQVPAHLVGKATHVWLFVEK